MKIEPCPRCYPFTNTVEVEPHADIFLVYCWGCQTEGPDGSTEEDAIRKWNAISLKKRSEQWSGG